MENHFKSSFPKFCLLVFLVLILLTGNPIFGQKLWKAYEKRDYEKFLTLLKSKPKLLYEKDYNGNNIVTNLCVSDDSIAYHYLDAILENCPFYNFNVLDDNQLTPLAYSIGGNLNNLKSLLKKNVNVNLCFKAKISPLIMSIVLGNEPAVEILINHGAKINYQDGDNRTGLIYASMYGYPAIVDKLLAVNADLTIMDLNGNTALFYAAGLQYQNDQDSANNLRTKPDKDVVSLLINKGADINQTNSAFWIPLMYSCDINNYEIIEMFLSAGVKVNHQDREGKTPLMISCSIGDLKTVKLLIDHKADISIKDNSGKTAISYALANNNSEIVTFLKKALEQNRN